MIIDVDDELRACAAVLTGITNRPTLIQRAVELLVRMESERLLGALGGTDRDTVAPPRRCG